MPNHYVNQHWNMITRTLENKSQWNFNQNTTIFNEGNGFEYVVWKMEAFLPWLHWVYSYNPSGIYAIEIAHHWFMYWLIIYSAPGPVGPLGWLQYFYNFFYLILGSNGMFLQPNTLGNVCKQQTFFQVPFCWSFATQNRSSRVIHLMYWMKKATLNSFHPSAVYMRWWTGWAFIQVMACRLFGAKPLPEPMFTYCQLDPYEQS